MTSEVDWPVVRLDDVADDITVGHVGPMATEYLPVGIPFLRSQNVEPFRVSLDDAKYVSQDFHVRLAKSALQPGDVVIVRTGRPGSAAVIPANLLVANCSDLVIVRPGPELDSHFLMYFINSAGAGHVASHLVGAVQQHFNVGSARTLRIPLPPLQEQRRIARALGALDDKIELNRRMNRTLESIAHAVFKSWFVDFDPVRKKMEDKTGGELGLPPSLAALFPEALDDDTGIPNGWQSANLADCVTVSREMVSPSEMGGGLVDHYSIPAFDDGRLPVVESGSSIKSNKFAVEHGVVLVSRLNPRIPRVWRPNVGCNRRSVCSTEFMVLTPKAPVTVEFLHGLLSSEGFAEKLASRVTGTSGSHQRVKPADALAIRVVLPRESLMRGYSECVGPVLIQAAGLLEQSRELGKLRDALLPRLMSGDVAVGGRIGEAIRV